MLSRLNSNSMCPSAPTKLANRAGVEYDIQPAISTSEINRIHASVLDKRCLRVSNNTKASVDRSASGVANLLPVGESDARVWQRQTSRRQIGHLNNTSSRSVWA